MHPSILLGTYQNDGRVLGFFAEFVGLFVVGAFLAAFTVLLYLKLFRGIDFIARGNIVLTFAGGANQS